ncbi:hypothetical protein Golob_004389, partial [Gossypium lobatum]|nr:hypothetical protein [Gossypium lobatum]
MDSIKVNFDATYNQFTKKAIVNYVADSTEAEVRACRSAVVLAEELVFREVNYEEVIPRQGNRTTYIIVEKGRRFNELWVWAEEAP